VKKVRLADRIPVSQTDDVKVRSVKISPKITPDEKGLFSWDLELAPKEKRTLAVEYIVQYPTEYTQSSFFKGKGRPQPQNNSDPFGSGQIDDFEMNSLQIQLKSLEKQF